MGYELPVAEGCEHTTVTTTSMTLLIVKTGEMLCIRLPMNSTITQARFA